MEPRRRTGAVVARFAADHGSGVAGIFRAFAQSARLLRLESSAMTNPVPLPPLFGQNNFEPARKICRGAIRLLHAMGYAAAVELPLPSGRRADIAAVGPSGEIWIVEVKSCLNDFRTDHKWEDYRAHCDRLFFAVDCDFPQHVIPDEAGLMVVDEYGGAILREANAHPLAAATRKALMLRLARIASSRLSAINDPRINSELS
jgi:hypothetical protein